ncbi:Speckle-type POZ protein, partial [Stegodyphus mimosarum]
MCPARFKWPPEKRDETKKTVSDDTLIVKCIFHQLKVPLGNKSALGSMNDIHDVENLSQDFSRLLQSSQCSDLLLCAENEIFHVHKAILWARAPKFSNDLGLQNWNVSSGPVKVALDPPVLRLLLQYLYSGKLKTDKAEYFAGLSRIADTYGLVDLKQKLYIFPTESFLTTRIKVDRKSFMWHVNLKSPAERFYNPTFRSGCIPGSEFQLILSVCKGSGGLRNVDVCVRRLFPDKENPVFLHLMISLIGGGGRLRLPDAKKHYFLTDEEWWDGCVIKGPSESFIQEADFCEHVYLQCDLAVSAGDSSVLERSLCSSNSDVCNMTDFFCYSQDLKQLYNIFLPKFTDCILRAGKVRYPVHRAILSARSMVFSRIFTECVSDNSSNVIEITDIESAILNIILVYVYTGIVEELDYVNAIKIYSAA